MSGGDIPPWGLSCSWLWVHWFGFQWSNVTIIIHFRSLEDCYCIIKFKRKCTFSLSNTAFVPACLVQLNSQIRNSALQNYTHFLHKTVPAPYKHSSLPSPNLPKPVSRTLPAYGPPAAIYCHVNALAQGMWILVYFLTEQLITIIHNPLSLASVLQWQMFRSCWWDSLCILGMLSRLEGLQVEPACCFGSWYHEKYVLFAPCQYLKIVASSMSYLTSPKASHILLWQSVILERPLTADLPPAFVN